MGTYTTTFKMYKPWSSEIVDVDQHLNYNWNILDKELKRLMEYRYTNVTSVGSGFTDRGPMQRWYKTWSNSIVFQDFDNNLTQDPAANVGSWVSASSLLKNGWGIKSANGLYYRLTSYGGIDHEVEWTGAIDKDGAVIPTGSLTEVLDLPLEITPKRSRYYLRSAGNTATGFSIARITVNRFGTIDVVRWGQPGETSGQNKIDFGGIRYQVELPSLP